MRTVFNQAECQNLKTALSKEWLETNGLGSFACSSIIGANVRRQNGLLVASLKPPVERHVLLSKMEDRARLGRQECHLSTNLYPGTVYPHGFNIQSEFRLRPWPTFRYVCDDFEIEKSVCLLYGENTVAEHTFGLMLSLSRKIHQAYSRTIRGDFSLGGLRGFDLKGRTLGVVGAGHIGLHVVRIGQISLRTSPSGP